jgi:acyl-CoA thioester hydrolase
MYQHDIRVRYGECDMQQVVFNAHYLAYADDAVMCWFADRLGGRIHEFDCMLKSVNLVWHRPLRLGDTAQLHCTVRRFGTTSFDVHVHGSVAGEASFEATIVYVSTTPGAPVPTPVPNWVKDALHHDTLYS